MTIHEAKAYLNGAYDQREKIKSKQAQINRLRDDSIKVTTSVNKLRVFGSQVKSPVENAVVKYTALEQDLQKDIEIFDFEYRKVAKAISTVDDATLRTLLEYRYLCFMKWEEIAVKMNYSWRHIHRLHTEALEKMAHNVTFKCDKV